MSVTSYAENLPMEEIKDTFHIYPTINFRGHTTIVMPARLSMRLELLGLFADSENKGVLAHNIGAKTYWYLRHGSLIEIGRYLTDDEKKTIQSALEPREKYIW